MLQNIQWTKALETNLRDQTITADEPGPVLKDFGLVLDYVGTKGVKSAGKYHLFPLTSLPELGPRLSRTVTLTLKRPQLRSHPYLQGLHLLLRASGLVHSEGSGAKARLVIDPSMLNQWDQLNPTERYFNLLEAFLRIGRPGMVGETGNDRTPFLSGCLQAWQFLEENDHSLRAVKEQYDLHLLGINRNFYQLALLDLFGLLKVESTRSDLPGWVPAKLESTPFGNAVFTRLAIRINQYSGSPLADDDVDEFDDEGSPGTATPRLGAWQPTFQPYLPEWRKNLVFPEREPREGTFIFRVSLGPLWRRIALSADNTLADLATWVLNSVDFDHDHLYAFTYMNHLGTKVRVLYPWSDEGPWAHETPLATLPVDPGASIELLYDFGASWRFTITLEKVAPPSAEIKSPKILERHSKSPGQYQYWDGD